MGVLDGQDVSQAITNPAFINKNIDDIMPNKLGFNRVASGSSIADIQASVNKLYTASGASESQTGTVYDATPGTITNGDNYQTSLGILADKFDAATGHEHTGAAGDAPPILGSSLGSVPLLGYLEQGTTFTAPTGGSSDVTSLMTGKSPSTSPTVLGVCTSSPQNKSRIMAATGTESYQDIVDASGNLVYGRITFAGSTWTLSYFSEQSASEMPYIFATPTSLLWWFQELFNPMVSPPVYNPTIQLFAPGSGGGGGGGGVSSIAATGNPALTGVVTLSAGTGIALTQVGQNIEIDNTGAGTTIVACRVGTNSSAQNFASSVFTDVTLASVDFDTASAWDGTDTYTIPEDGVYEVSGNFTFIAFGASNNRVIIQVTKNGTEELRGIDITKLAGTSIGFGVSGLINCLTGDLLKMQVFQDSGTDQNSINSDKETYFCINKVAPPGSLGPSGILVSARYTVANGVNTYTSGSAHVILYPTQDWDTHSAYDPVTGFFTAPIAGKYEIRGNVDWEASALGVRVLGTVVSGTTFDRFLQSMMGVTGVSAMQTAATIYQLSIGDTIGILASQSSGSILDASADGTSFIEILRVGD